MLKVDGVMGKADNLMLASILAGGRRAASCRDGEVDPELPRISTSAPAR
jgi:hypothetical protein